MTTADIHRLHPAACISGHQCVAPAEAARIAAAEVERMEAVEAASNGLFAIRSEINRLDARIRECLHEHDLLRRRLCETGARPHVPPFAPWLFWTLIGLMLVLEVPVNAAALDFLRLPALESYMLALFFGLANLLAAKTTARHLRQTPLRRSRTGEWLVVALANGVLLLAVWHVAELRSQSIEGSATASAFVALQLLFYLVAMALSLQQTDPVPAAEQAAGQLARARAELDRNWRRRARLAGRHNVALEQLRARLFAIEQSCLSAMAAARQAQAETCEGSAPEWMADPLSTALFVTIDLGEPLDEQPQTIGALVDAARRPG